MVRGYYFGGLLIQSDTVVAGLQPIEPALFGGAPDLWLSVVDGEPAPPDQLIFAWRGSFDLQLWSQAGGWLFTTPAFGSVHVSTDGRRLMAYRPADAAPGSLHNLLIGRVLPRVAILRNRLVLHAGSVEHRGQAILFVGPSGAGKSTLSAGLAQRGWTLLSDDASIVDGDTASIWTGSTGASLWSDSRDALALGDHEQQSLLRRPGKHWVELRGGAEQAATVRSLVFLSRQDDIVEPILKPMTKFVAAGRLLRHLVRFDPTDKSFAPHYLRSVTRLVDQAPAFVLEYPSDFSRLQTVADLLANDLLDAAA